ncbi:hypothetical protein HNY73_019265 [Argiope bruennichi]|uniref:Uncharacterized protein n=1 Tax=Argiope bruennichi TaxID=94029 RepID=A0A8T0EGX6_ARGBR|nr:hypothetical protein HNY73_019265 [Argiope bruennichi]
MNASECGPKKKMDGNVHPLFQKVSAKRGKKLLWGPGRNFGAIERPRELPPYLYGQRSSLHELLAIPPPKCLFGPCLRCRQIFIQPASRAPFWGPGGVVWNLPDTDGGGASSGQKMDRRLQKEKTPYDAPAKGHNFHEKGPNVAMESQTSQRVFRIADQWEGPIRPLKGSERQSSVLHTKHSKNALLSWRVKRFSPLGAIKLFRKQPYIYCAFPQFHYYRKEIRSQVLLPAHRF